MDFLQRLKDEQRELYEKSEKLYNFIDGDFMGIDVGIV